MNWGSAQDKLIADLDPLCADPLMLQVPQLNNAGELKGLVALLQVLCGRAAIESRSYNEILAIVRDIGIVAGSIQRHGYSPVVLAPELESILLRAAQLTDLPARDTLMHYTVWNPNGPRLRTYTSHEQEPHLIESIRISLPAIRDATRGLFRIRDMGLQDNNAISIAYKIADQLDVFLSGLKHAKHHVTPDAFISCFRPYFEPFVVGDSLLRGPGVVTMPLHIFDFLLWGSSETNQQYQLFTSDYIPYNTSEFRHYYLQTRNTPSFLDMLEAEAHLGENLSALQPLLAAVEVWFRKVRGFRGAHLKYSNKAYHGTTDHNFKTGSGGHTNSDMEVIASLTSKHSNRLDSLLKKELNYVAVDDADS